MTPSKKKPNQTPAQTDEMDFEASMELAESSIEAIESGDAGLEESVAMYERGMKALARCRDLLADAEQRVEDLTKELSASDAERDEA